MPKSIASLLACLALAFVFAIAAACGSSSNTGATAGADAAGDDTDADNGAIVEGGSTGDEVIGEDAALPLGTAITAPDDKWTWIDFPDSTCDDGSPTGIGVNFHSASDKLMVFFNGGGACWNYLTCVQLNTSTHGPFGATQFAAVTSAPLTGSIFDRADASNEFKDWNMVFVPYCTGDVHAGDAVQTYTQNGDSHTFHHEGHKNAVTFFSRLATTFAKASQVAITGSSAGGGGALFNYDTARRYWPGSKMLLVDDSLPLFEGNGISQSLRDAWVQSWNIEPLVQPICGDACKTDFSQFMKAIATKYPSDRMALLESEQDGTITQYFMLSGAQFSTDLTALDTDVLAPTGNWKHFFIPGTTHTMLGAQTTYMAGGESLEAWLGQMVTGDAAWTSKGP